MGVIDRYLTSDEHEPWAVMAWFDSLPAQYRYVCNEYPLHPAVVGQRQHLRSPESPGQLWDACVGRWGKPIRRVQRRPATAWDLRYTLWRAEAGANGKA